MAIVNSAHGDGSKHFTSLGVIGTLGTADVQGSALTLPMAVDPTTGAAYSLDLASNSLAPYPYDSITVAYPSGTTETYSYAFGTSALGTITVTYTDASKGSVSSVIKT